MLPPFVYPLYGLLYLFKRPDMLLQVLGLTVMQILVPLFWFSDQMVNKQHDQVFKNVFRSLHGDRPVRQLSEAERARLAEKVAERTAAKQARAHANPIKQDGQVSSVLHTLLFILGPPRPGAPISQRVTKRVLQAPVKLLFPAAPKLVAAAMQPASAPALATAALSPWLAAKGIRSAQEVDAVAAANRAQMIGFGSVAFGLGLVPVLSWILARLPCPDSPFAGPDSLALLTLVLQVMPGLFGCT